METSDNDNEYEVTKKLPSKLGQFFSKINGYG